MKIGTAKSIDAVTFNNDAAKGITARVLIGQKDGAPNFCMRMFEIAPGGHTPKHAHAWEHEMFYHAGQGEVFGEGRWNPVTAGAVVLVKGNEEHQVRNTGKDPLVFICLVPAGAPEI